MLPGDPTSILWWPPFINRTELTDLWVAFFFDIPNLLELSLTQRGCW